MKPIIPADRRRILVIGDVMDDILVRPRGPIRDDTDTTAEISQSPGGSAANFACWLAVELGNGINSGFIVEFIGRVGNVDLGRHSDALSKHGVHPRLQIDTQYETGKIVVLLEGEARSFLTARGANQNLSLQDITSEELSTVALVYLSGYSITDALASNEVHEFRQRVKASGAALVCDPGSAGFIEEFGPERFLSLVAGADIFLPSRAEAELVTGQTDALAAATHLAQHFSLVLVTLGREGVACAGEGINPQIFRTSSISAADSTGAGDAFAAGFIANLLQQPISPLAAAVERGSHLAIEAISLPGGRPASA